MRKKIFCVLLSIAMMISLTSNAFAYTEKATKYVVNIDNTDYLIEEEVVCGVKNIYVTDGTSEATITLTGNILSINTSEYPGSTFQYTLNECSRINTTRSSWSCSSLYWGYYCYYSDNYYSSHGMYFSLECGSEGSWSGFDNSNISARNLGYEFYDKVLDLNSAQVYASALSGAAAGAVAEALIAVGASAGSLVVVGVIAAIVSGAPAIAAWVSAWNTSLQCNNIYLQFTQTI